MSEHAQRNVPAEKLSRRELRRRREAEHQALVAEGDGADAIGEAVSAEDSAAQAGPAEEAPSGGVPEYTEDLRSLQEEIAASSTDDPTYVDPELLRRQEEMAARALRENRARRDLLPEAEAVVTGAEEASVPPVEATGAHGLDLQSAADESSRSAARRSQLIGLLIVVIFILLVAVGVVLFIPR